MDTNCRHWDEGVPAHVGSKTYNLEPFLTMRKGRLKPIELEELGGVRGRPLLHLQCHVGLDTLSWAMEGVSVTGSVFSEPAVEEACRLAGRPASTRGSSCRTSTSYRRTWTLSSTSSSLLYGA